MHSSHGKSRRRQTIDADDELMLPVSRIDDDQADSYSRSHHHSNRSNTQKASVADRNRYSQSSTSHRHNSARRMDDGAHTSGSKRDRIDDDDDYYDDPNRDRYTDSHGAYDAHDSKHQKDRLDHSSRHSHRHSEEAYFASSHTENGSWATSSKYERNRNDRDDWVSNDMGREREKGRYERDTEYHEAEDQSAKRGKERRKDDGTRGTRDGHSDDRHLQSTSRKSQRVEERSWEPAPSWKSREKEVMVKSSDSHSNRNNNRRNAKTNHQNRRNQYTHTRDRRDDGDMNNWQKRDYSAVTKWSTASTTTSASKRKQNNSITRSRSRSPSLSPSRSYSRSRSPAYSAYSHRSSRRSRSRSLSPKRRKYDRRERFVPNSSYRESRKDQQHERRSPSFSPVSRRNGDGRSRARRPSISSISSRSRSPSLSPARSKTKHRLPTVTTLRDIDLSAKNWSRLPPAGPKDRDFKQKNGGQLSGKKAAYPSLRENDLRLITQKAQKSSSGIDEPHYGPTANEIPLSPKLMRKMGAFRPVGKPPSSASIKKFFPGEDDDSDASPLPQRNRSPTPPAHSPVHDNRGESTHTDNNDHQARYSEESRRPQESLSASTQVVPPAEVPLRSPNHEILPSESTLSLVRHRADDEQMQYEAAPKAIRKMLPGDVYGIVSQVGEGTFGQVYKAQNAATGVYVAFKRIRMETERDGFPVTAMREIKLLQSLRHPNVVHLYEMIVSQGSVYMVFEYMDHDLTGLLSQSQFTFSDAHLKSFCSQMLSGLAYLHHKGVIHRDIKGSNILINNLGELKLGDFGLARFYQKRRRSDYTNRVITLWYRPPELLFGATVYGPEVDMWSAGCIMLELFCKKPVFQGNDEIHQLDVIYKVMGTPTANEWPGLAELPWYELVKPKESIRNHFREYFQKWLTPAGLDLAELLLAYDPAHRITAAQALETSYFKEEPPPEQPAGLSSLETEWHEYESKRERARKKRKLEGGSEPQQ